MTNGFLLTHYTMNYPEPIGVYPSVEEAQSACAEHLKSILRDPDEFKEWEWIGSQGSLDPKNLDLHDYYYLIEPVPVFML